jgi:hypothetical protein
MKPSNISDWHLRNFFISFSPVVLYSRSFLITAGNQSVVLHIFAIMLVKIPFYFVITVTQMSHRIRTVQKWIICTVNCGHIAFN